MSLILVVGIPHGGTTILRKIIGNIPKVYECVNEVDAIFPVDVDKYLKRIANQPYEAIVVKSPFTPMDLVKRKAPNVKIVYIIKNPYDIYGSYRLRFKSEGHYTKNYIDRYGIQKYEALASLWLHLNKNDKDIFTVKYEDLFDNNYEVVKKMVAWLGFEWSDDIVLSKRIAGHQHVPAGSQMEVKNTPADNASYRYYQINQEFRNMTGESKEHIFPETKKKLDSMAILKELGYDKYS